ncbi:MAG: dUTP diphosphatase [Clostridiaceae bacterium]|nr:dUTP diphosphatase [Clostridiaceae bacterium]
MNLDELFKLQMKLDKKIVEQHALQNRSLVSEKILALQVEIGELANETRCFKYWSTKKPSDKVVILEEYVDCIHFLLSIGLDYNFTDISVDAIISESKLTDQFINIYIDLNDFIICSSKDHYATLFEDFLSLGSSIGFSKEDIVEHYLIKNNTNHERQASGY